VNPHAALPAGWFYPTTPFLPYFTAKCHCAKSDFARVGGALAFRKETAVKRIKNYLAALSIISLLLVMLPTSGQTTQDFPSEFSPLKTSRPEKAPTSLEPPSKFIRKANPVANKYMVVLRDDVASDKASLDVRRSQVRAVADNLALRHGGRVGFTYQTALKGFSIELPNEKAAIALSRNPQVKFVEQSTVGRIADTQFNPPWGLDRIDQAGPVGPVAPDGTTAGTYNFNATGSGVTAYVLDTGIRSTHVDFGGRASVGADFVGEFGCMGVNNDCHGHGTHVAGTVGGNTFGVAKGITIRAVKVCDSFGDCDPEVVAAAIDWLTADHINSGNRAVVNISLRFFERIFTLDNAVVNSTNAGVTFAVAAGNEFGFDAGGFSPAGVTEAITVGSSDMFDSRSDFSNIGDVLDLFAPGSEVLSASAFSDTGSFKLSGTSMASPTTAGAVSLYLQGRTPMTNCGAHPIQGPATSSGGGVSTCPDRVIRFMSSNTNLSALADVPSGTVNRLLFTGSLPTTTNPIDNQRFFVWSHYPDFLDRAEPDEGGLNHWTNNITGPCATGVNDNNACTREWRIHTSRAFWVHQFPSLFNAQGTTDNAEFVRQCYRTYLRREADEPGFQHWLNDLSQYGNPANYDGVNHLIDAFLVSIEYRQRFGQP
jgi:subtilisin family serine protease